MLFQRNVLFVEGGLRPCPTGVRPQGASLVDEVGDVDGVQM